MVEHLTPATVFKSLADETRARMTLLIAREGELCVCELTTALEESQPKISRHLALLRSSGVLEDRRQGQWVYYRLHPDLPDWCMRCSAPSWRPTNTGCGRMPSAWRACATAPSAAAPAPDA